MVKKDNQYYTNNKKKTETNWNIFCRCNSMNFISKAIYPYRTYSPVHKIYSPRPNLLFKYDNSSRSFPLMISLSLPMPILHEIICIVETASSPPAEVST